MADAVRTELYYRLACSSLLVTGSRNTLADWEKGAEEVTADSDVTLFVQADPLLQARVRLPEHTGRGSHEVSLKLGQDGRLVSASGSAKGILGEAISATASVVAFVGGIAGAALSKGLVAAAPPPTGVPKPKTPSQTWAEEHEKDASRLSTALETLNRLHDAVVSTGGSIADGEAPASAFRKLVALRTAITALESEIAAIVSRREAWHNANYSRSESLRMVLPTHEIFRLDDPPAVPSDELDPADLDLDHGPKRARHLLDHLGLAIVEVTRTLERDELTVDDATTIEQLMRDVERGELPLGVFFRVPRPAVIALYKQEIKANKPTLRLESFEQYWLVDRFSRIGSIPLDGPGEMTASITFSASGVPETAAVGEQSLLGQALEALGRTPEQIAAGIGHAKTVVEGWDALRASRSDREVRALKTRKKQLELEIAKRGLEADAEHHETLQQLKDQLERLKTAKDIGDFGAVASPRDQLTAERKDLLDELRTEVRIARAEAQLASFSGDGSS